MKNRDMPAKPIFDDRGCAYDGYSTRDGLTKLEYAAIHILASCCSDMGFSANIHGIKWAVQCANELFDELEKEQE